LICFYHESTILIQVSIGKSLFFVHDFASISKVLKNLLRGTCNMQEAICEEEGKVGKYVYVRS
jgi:hypothetical protein